MGYYVNETERMFRGVSYQQKSTSELKVAFERKIQRINESIDERTKRVQLICDEFAINDQQLTNLVLQYQDSESDFTSFESQGVGAKIVPAGAIANIVQEKKMTESERSQLRKLELIFRNLQETEVFRHPRTGAIETRDTTHELTDSELEYLGF